MIEILQIKDVIQKAIDEDLGDNRIDITSSILVPDDQVSSAEIVAKENGILCGIDVAKEIFHQIDPDVNLHQHINDSDRFKTGDIIASIHGKTKNILKAERSTLNFLQHLCGIATITGKFVEIASKYNVQILDTRKTIPGLRYLQKYAVLCGGGKNHRFGLFDEYLMKDNHILACGGLDKALQRLKMSGNIEKTIIEIESLNDLKKALSAGARRIMLDNMETNDIYHAKKIAEKYSHDIYLEISGMVGLENIKEIARTGINSISIGKITHSVKAIDINMKLQIVDQTLI